MSFEQVGQKSASCRPRSVAVNHIDLRNGWLKIAHVRRERGLELFDDDFELSLRQNAFEFAQHQRVRRQDTDRQF